MNRLSHNPRIVALVIYALLVNLVWFAAASAHQLDLTDAWCSQSSNLPEASGPASQSDRHEACHQFCGAARAALAPAVVAAITHAPVIVSDAATDPAAMPRMAASPWQARGPPLA